MKQATKTVLISPETHKRLKLAAVRDGRQINGPDGLVDAVLGLYLDQCAAGVHSCEGTDVVTDGNGEVTTSAV